ncbi:MAG: hypothetical protein H5T98_00525 [Syntrophomonadaceae bacterium]|nr:hypothetical protein [Syntrophomonadaceae bacterium]
MMKYVSVVIPEELDRQLRFACADQSTTKSSLVRKLIEEYLEKWREEKGGQIVFTIGDERPSGSN